MAFTAGGNANDLRSPYPYSRSWFLLPVSLSVVTGLRSLWKSLQVR